MVHEVFGTHDPEYTAQFPLATVTDPPRQAMQKIRLRLQVVNRKIEGIFLVASPRIVKNIVIFGLLGDRFNTECTKTIEIKEKILTSSYHSQPKLQ